MSRRAAGLAVSVPGPAHLALDEACQDASGWALLGDLTVGVAADGLGSYRDAGLGARSAVQLALALAGDLAGPPGHPPDEAALHGFLTLLATRWAVDGGAQDRPCTFLFAMLASWGAATIQVGDGSIWAAFPDGSVQHLSPEPDAAGYTAHLAMPDLLRHAVVHCFHGPVPAGFLLATDGVTCDLEEAYHAPFVASLLARLKADGPEEAGRQVRAELEAWPVPGHHDDKTIVAIHREEQHDA